jgi:hypothetical protein
VLAYFGDYRKPLVVEMRRRGILVRDRNSDPGCAGCVRITVGTREQTDRLLRELSETFDAIGFKPQPRRSLAAATGDGHVENGSVQSAAPIANGCHGTGAEVRR